MESNGTPGQVETKVREASAGRRARSTSRRGSASSPQTTRSARASSSKASGIASEPKTAEQAEQRVTLPGRLFRRDKQWWWDVRLPGEDAPVARVLATDDAETSTEDIEVARQLAVQLWERAVTCLVEQRVRVESSETAAKLKARFLEKVRDFSQIVETTQARLEAEIQARAEAEAKLKALVGRPPEETVVCECCGSPGVPAGSAQRIDSGQLLCSECLAALHAEISRIDAEMSVGCSA